MTGQTQRPTRSLPCRLTAPPAPACQSQTPAQWWRIPGAVPGRFSPSATRYRSPYRGYVVPGLCAAGRSHTLLPAAKPATVAPGGTENGHPLPKPHRRRVERRMPTAGDIDQFIFIHHPTEACSSVRLAMYSTIGRTMRGNCAEST